MTVVLKGGPLDGQEIQCENPASSLWVYHMAASADEAFDREGWQVKALYARSLYHIRGECGIFEKTADVYVPSIREQIEETHWSKHIVERLGDERN